MNRRGFFGALATLPFLGKAAAAVPAPAAGLRSVAAIELAGMEGWIPAEPPRSPFFGIERSVLPPSYWDEPQNADLKAALLEAADQLARLPEPRWLVVAGEDCE